MSICAMEGAYSILRDLLTYDIFANHMLEIYHMFTSLAILVDLLANIS
jgi:hypothetical protein